MEDRYTLLFGMTERIILKSSISVESYTTDMIVEKWDGDEWQRQAELTLASTDLELLLDFLDEIKFMCKR